MQLLRHTFAHTLNKKGGHFSQVKLLDVKDTQISVVSVTLRAEEITVVFFLTDCILVSALCSKKPFLTLGLRQIKYIKHLPVSCYFLHGVFFLSELVCSSSDFDHAVAIRPGITGLCVVVVTGHGTSGVRTEKNGD